jgi:ribosomal protein L37E
VSALVCNFCGLGQHEARRLWSNDREDRREPLVLVCDRCVESAFAAQVESGLTLPYVQAGALPG